MAHWEASMEWDTTSETDSVDVKLNGGDITSGSYHCKSALRTFESNMRLFLFKSSYNKLHSYIGSDPYDESVLFLLPDLWNCFYNKTHGLDRILCLHTSKTHSTGSPAFVRWSDFIQEKILHNNPVSMILMCEARLFHKTDTEVAEMMEKVSTHVKSQCNRVLYLVHYLYLVLIVMNFRYNPKRPDIKCTLPGIISEIEETIYRVRYNDFLYCDIHKDAIRIKTPVYDQIVQKDFVLNLSDKISERLNVMIGAIIIKDSCPPTSMTVFEDTALVMVIGNIIEWGDNLLYKRKNHAFDLIGKYEAYCVSAILKGDDPLIWNNDEFQNNLLQDDHNNQPMLYSDAVQLLDILNRQPPNVLSEIHGLWRIWGHPIIDIEGGMRKMEATSLKKTNVDKKETSIGVRTFKLTLFQNYKEKHGHYPLSNMSPQEDLGLYKEHLSGVSKGKTEEEQDMYNPLSYLHYALRNNRPIDNRASRYVHDDWDSVRLMQNFQIPQSLNLATMIKDKAISQTRSELVNSVKLRNSVFDSTKRRGVLKWLSEQTMRLRSYLSNIDENGLSDNDSIIGLYPKERELKTKARFFSLMSYNMRMYVTATEEILSKYLLPYFPMITMSDTLLNMIIRLYNMTTNIGKTDKKVVYSMNIDFSKWNQNMREATNEGIFRCIDSVIGFRSLISRTHDIFRRSYLYLCSGEYIPKIVAGSLTTEHPYSRIGDESGKEGLRQKGWTITTVCDILSLAFTHNVKIELIGGGDNQVLTVEVKSLGKNKNLSEEEQLIRIKDKMVRFRNALAKKMEKRGLPLKLEETWISHRLLMYNKIMYLDGVPLPGRVKVISRIFANANEGICTIGSITSTLGTGFQAVSAKDYNPITAWIVSRYLTYINVCMYYTSNPISGTRRLDQQILKSQDNLRNSIKCFGEETTQPFGNKTKFTTDKTLSIEEMYIIVLYYHKVLGGPGIGSPLSYIMKGFPDTLSEALTLNYHVIKRHRFYKTPYAQMIENITSVNKSSVKHWEHLLEDPVSVNHDAPSHGIAALRNQAEQVMKSATIKNVQFKELIKLGNPEYLKKLSEGLCRSDIIEPRILHDIVGATIPGYVNTVLSKVDQSSTLSKLSTDADILYEIYCTEMKYYIYLAQKIKIKRGHILSDCPTEDARKLRNETWGKTVEGVTTPHPAAYLECQQHSSSSGICDQNYITVLAKRDHKYGKLIRGPFMPYFGSYTAEKFKMGVLASAYGEEDLLKRSMKIQKLLGWRFQKGTRAYDLIQRILSCVTDADPEKFLPIPEEITGDVEHRYKDMATKHGGIPTNLIRDYTNISCCTSTLIDHSKGASNETLHFQAAIIHCSMMSNLASMKKEICTDIYHFHEVCKKCIAPTSGHTGDISNDTDISVLSCPGNELMYIKESDIPIHFHSLKAFVRSQGKSKILGETVKFHDVTPTVGRETWLLLFIATLTDKNCKMKKSTMKLMLSQCSNYEIFIILRAFLICWMMEKKQPWSLHTSCDIKDIVDNYLSTINMILADTNFMMYMIDNNIITSDHRVAEDIYRILMNRKEEIQIVRLHTAFCKFQDPEYKACKKVLLAAKNPSLSTCSSCMNNIHEAIEDNKIIGCSIHGDLKIDMKYHLYSLDKVSKIKGVPLEESDIASGRKRKRGIDLLYAMEESRKRSQEKEVTRRSRQFSVCDDILSSDILMHITHPTLSFRVTSSFVDERNKLHGSIEKGYNKEVLNEEGHFSTILHYSICFIEGVESYINQSHRGRSDPVETYTIGVDVQNNMMSTIKWRKVLHLVSHWVEKRGNMKLHVRLLCSDVKDMEDYNGVLMEELVNRSRSSINSNCMTVCHNGDQAVDITEESKECDFILSSNLGVYNMSICDILIMSTGASAYHDLYKIQENQPGGIIAGEVSLIRPKVSINNPMTVILKLTHDRSSERYISEDRLLSAMDDDDVEYIYDVHSLIYDNEGGFSRSLIGDLLDATVVTKMPIMTEDNLNFYREKISTGIKFHSLSLRPSDPLPWRCLLLVKILLGLDIIVSKDPRSTLEYYSKFGSVSFQGASYRKLHLYRTKDTAPDLLRASDRIMNWTSKGIGKGLSGMVREIRACIYITYKQDVVLRSTLDL